MSYYDNVNNTLIDLLPAGSYRVCEIGCGGGATAAAVKARNPGTFYVGVDIADEPLKRARAYLDIALCRNLDSNSDWDSDTELNDAIPIASFDYFICGDVLEHLYDPDAVLQNVFKRLKPGGALLTSIPNVQHWSVFAQLIRGSWPRLDSGVFDRTHIRWFALEDMRALLSKAGFLIETSLGRVFDEAQAREFLEFLEPLALYLGIDPEKMINEALPLQYVFLARKPLN